MSTLLKVGVITGARGVRGEVKLRCFLEDVSLLETCGLLCDEQGKPLFPVSTMNKSAGQVTARIPGVATRDAAEALKGIALYLPRSALPPAEADTWYAADLVGLAACTPDGTPIGKVIAVHDYGAGAIIEVRCADGREEMYPFRGEVVQEVDVKAGRVVLAVPEVI